MKGQEALMDITPKGYDKAAELFVARVTTEAASDAVYWIYPNKATASQLDGLSQGWENHWNATLRANPCE